MIRRLTSVLATLLCAAGLALVVPGTPVASAQVVPHHGVYEGTVQSAPVSFTFGGEHSDRLTNFYLNRHLIGGAHVSDGAFEACHEPVCFRGGWVSATVVEGAVRVREGEWQHFRAVFTPQPHARPGGYDGRDSRGALVHFVYRDNRVIGFHVGSRNLGDATVEHNRFTVCADFYCVHGHWQSASLVVGTHNVGSGTFSFQAHNYG